MGFTQATTTGDHMNVVLETAHKNYLGMLMLNGANQRCYKSLKDKLDNNYAKGLDNFPVTWNAVLHFLNSRKEHTMAHKLQLTTDGKLTGMGLSCSCRMSQEGKETTGHVTDAGKEAHLHILPI